MCIQYSLIGGRIRASDCTYWNNKSVTLDDLWMANNSRYFVSPDIIRRALSLRIWASSWFNSQRMYVKRTGVNRPAKFAFYLRAQCRTVCHLLTATRDSLTLTVMNVVRRCCGVLCVVYRVSIKSNPLRLLLIFQQCVWVFAWNVTHLLNGKNIHFITKFFWKLEICLNIRKLLKYQQSHRGWGYIFTFTLYNNYLLAYLQYFAQQD